MTNELFLKTGASSGDTRYIVYNSPAGDLYLIGNDSILQAIVFKNKKAGRLRIEKLLKNGTTAQIRAAASFLTAYFASITGKGLKPGLRIKVKVRERIITVLFNGRSLHLDLSGFTQKEIAVYRELIMLPAGKTISYKELSQRAGVHAGARFAGNAMAKNIFPIIIPCHRVIKSDGTRGNYSAGIDIKNYLLDHENK